ncbi:uncharacterized protein LOC127878343 isoform X2 [Dreissena polymorpha]|uniref:uncharacterized protein LOC127878343 isoform X1 n=1 Tax=Dreissena polymorpha TaxID=45954 RepID=UPI0022641EAB|nr:uncharacterized protein LOC127878343 isoform X1 [Dreissena polymorpha]XP_052280837.1 uncharacterized protein LOC127878343 isoform X1 [Dreissena polymorpha]XP_052280842.1 uncharacterized protein LOC127878343 isoform X2 [Dreissena polymorpha]
MCETFKKEFTLSNVGFSHSDSDSLVFSQWKWNAGIYLSYRLLTAGYALFAFIYIFREVENPQHTLMAYVTIWSFLILTIYLVMSVFVTSYHILTSRGRSRSVCKTSVLPKAAYSVSNGVSTGLSNTGFTVDGNTADVVIDVNEKIAPTPYGTNKQNDVESATSTLSVKSEVTWYMIMTWTLADIVYVFAFIVTVVYFGALYPSIGHTSYGDVNVHGVNSFLVLIDAFIVARPVRLLHALYPALYGLCYVVFNTVYWTFDKDNNVLYPNVLDWNHPEITSAFIVGLTLVGIPLFQLMHFGIYIIRLYIYKRIYGSEVPG